MTARRSDRGGIRTVLVILLAVVALVAAGGAVAYEGGAFDRWRCTGECETAEVLPALDPAVPDGPVVEQVLPVASGAGLDAGSVRRAVAGLLGRKAMGNHVGFAVADLGTGEQVWASESGSYVPASTQKILTSLAAMRAIGPDARFRTTVVRSDVGGPAEPTATTAPTSTPTLAPTASSATDATGSPPTASGTARIVLVGGGDPYLTDRGDAEARTSYPTQASLDDLAEQTAAGLRADGVGRVRMGYDASLFTGPAVNPTWEPGYITSFVTSPVSALWVDQGEDDWRRVADPAAQAAQVFAARLRAHGIAVSGTPRPRSAPEDSTELASVESGTVAEIVQSVLETSDNEGAEVLLRQVAIAAGEPASFAGGVAAVRDTLTAAGIDWTGVRMRDGSGLSRDNRITVGALLSAIVIGSDLFDRYPVAGFNGSLAARFTAPGTDPGLGEVRAKTGTLSGVHGLAGITVDAGGTPVAFVALADRVRLPQTLAARANLDRIAARLSACACSPG
ncbi:D-alanyl-D-alanine carboxypeptidase/D-alanyl-D-alanine-endopeptidase (penicillin-binding protein 4) [Mumia flava]|uniref:D-alanyl-D-alanine carboxypeptidase/D-alanyl-D-alanine-endopeptidase (Penicillin-binding protein 4) n=1 Tax=Mumia flava TaxID=1348852 RepID=A0A2M9BJI1_9ACTN|nr:D-alanyl-D-alanine carboxypeptidase/D-alanyl-D-alanine-endopeptidase [Mumia flava]PJJ58093.1 D-alanyl-D-alanine carboxypeptidase/D-alanyl-D-alanine-endopeptidase (penicillin-binding protein 4) [Mumia flava]